MKVRERIARAKTEVAVAKRARGLRATGITLREVAEALNAERIPSRCGGRWSPESVRRLIARWPGVEAGDTITREPATVILREPIG